MMAEGVESTLGPWTLSLVSIGDDISHTLSETTYPYKNGADIEDMGVDPETFKFSCVIKNKDYEDNFVQIRNWFLSYFPSPIELVHPEHGVVEGYPRNASFSEDRRRKFAEFTFEFVVAGIQPETQNYTDPYESNLEEATACNEEAMAAIAESMQQAGVPDVEGEDWSLLDKWGELGDAARAFASAVNQGLGQVLGVIESVKAPLDAISATIDYLDTLSGTLTRAFQECLDSFTGLARRIDDHTSSKASISTLVTSATEMLGNVAGMPATVYGCFATLAAATISTEAGRLISEDEKRLGESMARENVVVDDVEGRSIAKPSAPVLVSPQDMEDSLAMAREFVQKVLPVSSSPDRLKKQVATLSEAVLRIKMEYMTTKKIEVTHETPLHKIAVDNGLSYQAAERLCALNNVKNPTFMIGEVLVYES